MKKKERRYSKRLAVHINIKVFRLDKKTMRTVRAYLLDARDMTKEGVFLRGNAAFPLDTRLRLEFNLPGGDTPVVADARVAWQAKPSHPGYYPGMGVSITRIRRGDGKRLRDFLRLRLRNYRHAVKLKNMYMQLKDMGARLYELERSHMQAEHFRKVIERAIIEIDSIAHLIDKEVWEVKSL
ncbi:MAG: PilZ domain-containing protein [Candidatus Omnitrophota bacterium]|jgi:hypothetical protein